MPPDGPLAPEQIDLIKTWIDEGAEWPDELSGEARKAATTPLMHAALYGDAKSVRLLLDRGADPNTTNGAAVTALMYAVDDLEKTKLLLGHGADPNARSKDGQTPFLIVASRPGAFPVVKLLLDHGANPSGQASFATAALVSAAVSSDADLIKLLLERSEKKFLSLAQAVRLGCAACVDVLIASASKNDLNEALLQAIPRADVPMMRMLLERGATPPAGVLPSLALSPDAFPMDLVNSLIARGADINARNALGTVLDLARLQGDTALVHALLQAGAREESVARSPILRLRPAASIRAAIERSMPLLDRADAAFISRASCISCHNNALAPMTRAAVRKSGIPVNEEIAVTKPIIWPR
jgi:ankyrin repeat protein